MDWAKGYSASFHMAIVDPESWRDVEEVRITGGSISKTDEGLRESADITCRDFERDRERWIRVWMHTRQAGTSGRVALFTGLAVAPGKDIDGAMVQTPLECYSVLKPADDVLMQRGWYAPSGANGAKLVKRMLAVTPAPIRIEGESPALQQAIIAEDGESRLSMSNKVLDTIGWRLRITGMGEIVVCEKAKEPSVTLGAGTDVVVPSIKIERDWFDCPNVFRAVSDDMVAVARDDAEESILSTETRGREVWKEETSCDMNEGETVAEYAMRRLREEQRTKEKITYKRRFDPGVEVTDLVRLHYPRQHLQGIYCVAEQNIEIGGGAEVSEEVYAWM